MSTTVFCPNESCKKQTTIEIPRIGEEYKTTCEFCDCPLTVELELIVEKAA